MELFAMTAFTLKFTEASILGLVGAGLVVLSFMRRWLR